VQYSTCFHGIYLPHSLIRKDNILAFLLREVCLGVFPIKQDYRAIMRKSGFPLGGKVTEFDAHRLID
jgi:hypothetical protein